jgi:hypothetical protein
MNPAMPSSERRSSGPSEARNWPNRERVVGAAVVTRPTLAPPVPLLQPIGDKDCYSPQGRYDLTVSATRRMRGFFPGSASPTSCQGANTRSTSPITGSSSG